METLFVFHETRLVGTVFADETFRLSFQYAQAWIERQDSFPISITMPLRSEAYPYPIPHVFFENLLPEDELRKSLERGMKIPANSPYQFLKTFGHDLAGALALETSSEVPVVDHAAVTEVPWTYVDEAIDEGKKLYQAVTRDFGAKFSLAGAQDKVVVIYDPAQDRIFVPKQGAPTTHILKIDLAFRNSQTVYNEYFCLSLAKRVGLKVPAAKVRSGRHPFLLIERYDRVTRPDGTISRIHQEDFCQAQGKASSQKYEQRGGPSFVDHYNLVKRHSHKPIPDLEALLNWLCFNLIIGNNDSHGKNLSFLYDKRRVALAPTYDLLSTEVYGGRFDQNFAFKVGSSYDFRALRVSDFTLIEQDLGLRKGVLLATFRTVAATVKTCLPDCILELKEQAPGATIGERIADTVGQRLQHFAKASDLLG